MSHINASTIKTVPTFYVSIDPSTDGLFSHGMWAHPFVFPNITALVDVCDNPAFNPPGYSVPGTADAAGAAQCSANWVNYYWDQLGSVFTEHDKFFNFSFCALNFSAGGGYNELDVYVPPVNCPNAQKHVDDEVSTSPNKNNGLSSPYTLNGRAALSAWVDDYACAFGGQIAVPSYRMVFLFDIEDLADVGSACTSTGDGWLHNTLKDSRFTDEIVYGYASGDPLTGGNTAQTFSQIWDTRATISGEPFDYNSDANMWANPANFNLFRWLLGTRDLIMDWVLRDAFTAIKSVCNSAQVGNYDLSMSTTSNPKPYGKAYLNNYTTTKLYADFQSVVCYPPAVTDWMFEDTPSNYIVQLARYNITYTGNMQNDMGAWYVAYCKDLLWNARMAASDNPLQNYGLKEVHPWIAIPGTTVTLDNTDYPPQPDVPSSTFTVTRDHVIEIMKYGADIGVLRWSIFGVKFHRTDSGETYTDLTLDDLDGILSIIEEITTYIATIDEEGVTDLSATQFNFYEDMAFSGMWETSSSTSNTIGTGSKTFTVDTGLAYTAGSKLMAWYDSSNYMSGTVTSYNVTNGQIVIDIASVIGSGTYNSWKIHRAYTWSANYVVPTWPYDSYPPATTLTTYWGSLLHPENEDVLSKVPLQTEPMTGLPFAGRSGLYTVDPDALLETYDTGDDPPFNTQIYALDYAKIEYSVKKHKAMGYNFIGWDLEGDWINSKIYDSYGDEEQVDIVLNTLDALYRECKKVDPTIQVGYYGAPFIGYWYQVWPFLWGMRDGIWYPSYQHCVDMWNQFHRDMRRLNKRYVNGQYVTKNLSDFNDAFLPSFYPTWDQGGGNDAIDEYERVIGKILDLSRQYAANGKPIYTFFQMICTGSSWVNKAVSKEILIAAINLYKAKGNGFVMWGGYGASYYLNDWRYETTASVGTWGAITNGKLALLVKDVWIYVDDSHGGGINFTGVATYDDVAERIQDAINASIAANIAPLVPFYGAVVSESASIPYNVGDILVKYALYGGKHYLIFRDLRGNYFADNSPKTPPGTVLPPDQGVYNSFSLRVNGYGGGTDLVSNAALLGTIGYINGENWVYVEDPNGPAITSGGTPRNADEWSNGWAGGTRNNIASPDWWKVLDSAAHNEAMIPENLASEPQAGGVKISWE